MKIPASPTQNLTQNPIQNKNLKSPSFGFFVKNKDEKQSLIFSSAPSAAKKAIEQEIELKKLKKKSFSLIFFQKKEN